MEALAVEAQAVAQVEAVALEVGQVEAVDMMAVGATETGAEVKEIITAVVEEAGTSIAGVECGSSSSEAGPYRCSGAAGKQRCSYHFIQEVEAGEALAVAGAASVVKVDSHKAPLLAQEGHMLTQAEQWLTQAQEEHSLAQEAKAAWEANNNNKEAEADSSLAQDGKSLLAGQALRHP